MDEEDQAALLHCLEQRTQAIAAAWYTAIAKTCYVPFSAAQVRLRLVELTRQAILSLVSVPFDTAAAEQIGSALLDLHFTHQVVLGRTQRVLLDELRQGLEAYQFAALQPALSALLGGIATGYVRARTKVLLAEQQSIQGVLVAELRTAEQDVRAARDYLEAQVERRTEELRTSQERYRDLLENIEAVIVTVDAQGMVTYVSPPISRMFGYTPEQIVGRRFQQFVYPDDLPRVEQDFLELKPVSEYRILTSSGDVRWLRASARPVIIGGQLVEGHVVLTDITERVKAEEALHESEQRWRMLVECAPDFVLTIDREGRIVYMNRPGPLGVAGAPVDYRGRQVWTFMHPDYEHTARAAVERVFTTGTAATYEAPLVRQDGTVVWYSGRLGPLWRGAEIASAMLIARDITERKKLEETIESHVQDAAHELRAPLAKTQMSLELLLDRLHSDMADRTDLVRFGTIALDNVHRLVDTVGAVLDLARLEADTAAYRREPVGVADLVQGSIVEIEPLAAAKGLSLAASVPQSLPAVEGDPEKLDRVLRNLIDNSIKFSSKGQILVAAQFKDGQVEIAVSDQGCGILPDNLERVFDRFFQERTRFAGAGVGLPMCRTIVEAHGGRIWAESEGRDMGTTMRFALPALSAPLD